MQKFRQNRFLDHGEAEDFTGMGRSCERLAGWSGTPGGPDMEIIHLLPEFLGGWDGLVCTDCWSILAGVVVRPSACVAVLRVPPVPAVLPQHVFSEWESQEVQAPRDDDVVVHTNQEGHHHHSKTDACNIRNRLIFFLGVQWIRLSESLALPRCVDSSVWYNYQDVTAIILLRYMMPCMPSGLHWYLVWIVGFLSHARALSCSRFIYRLGVGAHAKHRYHTVMDLT